MMLGARDPGIRASAARAEEEKRERRFMEKRREKVARGTARRIISDS
jgi:hypothetical protein